MNADVPDRELTVKIHAVGTISAGNVIDTQIDWLRDTLKTTEYGKVGICFDVVEGQAVRVEHTCVQSVKLKKKENRAGG